MKKHLDPRHFIVKSNQLIEARYRLSLQESHVILWLLQKIYPDDEDFKSHRLDTDEFSSMVGLEVNGQYGELQKITENLMKRILKIKIPETGDILQVAWLSSALYKKRKGCVMLSFDPKLKPYLLQLQSHFTKINIIDTLKLKSIHAIRVFELLLQYESIGKRNTSIKDLRDYCGIEKEEYKKYSHFKVKVIERAKIEINKKTEYEVDYEEIKESRKVSEIKWTIQKKTHFAKAQSEKVALITKELRSKNVIIEQLIEYGFSNQAATRILKNNQETNVINAIKAVDIQIQRGHVKNAKAMLTTAIKECWHPERYLNKKSIKSAQPSW